MHHANLWQGRILAMVVLVQLAERQIVALEVKSSTLLDHPIFLNPCDSGGVSPSGKALDSDSNIRRFESCHPSQSQMYGLLAQSVEHLTFNQGVPGSSPG